jgi:hypothetical protein
LTGACQDEVEPIVRHGPFQSGSRPGIGRACTWGRGGDRQGPSRRSALGQAHLLRSPTWHPHTP